jgi:hypothetical protein
MIFDYILLPFFSAGNPPPPPPQQQHRHPSNVNCFSFALKTRAQTTNSIALYMKMSAPQAHRPPPTPASLLLLPAHANPRLAPQVLPRCSFPLPHRILIAETTATTSMSRYMQPLCLTHHVTRLLLCSPPPSPPLPSTRPRPAA